MPALCISELSSSDLDLLQLNISQAKVTQVAVQASPRSESQRVVEDTLVKAPVKQLKGRFIGVGVGPGDPELMTLKAWRLIQSSPVVSYLINAEGDSQAKSIAHQLISDVAQDQEEIAILMPMLTDRTQANLAYDAGTVAIRKALDAGLDVVFLCEGDPLFFSSFAYLLERLESTHTCQVIPGISSIHAAAAALKHPLAMLGESLAIVSGRHTDEHILQALLQHDSLAIIKVGAARARILLLLEQASRIEDAQYLEFIGRDNQYICHDVKQLAAIEGPYFSLFLVTRRAQSRRE